MRPTAPAYTYRAIVVSIYDGDTWTVDIDCGFGIWLRKQKLRLYGVDTPELRGDEREAGLAARDWCRELAPPGTEILLETMKDKTGKYGRWLAVIWLDGLERSLNTSLIETGHARAYDGGAR